jgi:hypothetical protein
MGHPDKMARYFIGVLGVAAVLTGCGSDSNSGIPDDCNPLGGVQCLMPWPSSVYLQEDGATATGFRVAIPEGAMPVNADGYVVDPTPWNRYDGFGPTGVILAGFPSGVDATGLPPHTDLDASLAADSPIILLMETREEWLLARSINTPKPERRSRHPPVGSCSRCAAPSRSAGDRAPVRRAASRPRSGADRWRVRYRCSARIQSRYGPSDDGSDPI